MGSRLAIALSVVASTLLFTAACGPSGGGNGDGDGGGTGTIDSAPGTIDGRHFIDATPAPDGTIAYPDAEPYADGGTCNDWVCTSPVNDGCIPAHAEVCGNGSDDNCDGRVDENCPCQAGAVQACFRGPPGRRGVGSCVDGQQTCQGSGEFTSWGPCTGGIAPGAEACDTQDNDCNGCADDNPACCTVDLACPGPGDMPDGQPFQPYVINGAGFFGGPVSAWQWTVSGGPCDQLFVSEGHAPSFTLAGQTSSTLTINPTLSGDYTVTVVMTLPDGTTRTCTFIVHIGGPGLRVELCWDTTGSADIDLHVHKPGTTTQWFGASTSSINNDDCYYFNCKATTYASNGRPNWGYANSPLTECQGGPEGASWVTLGYCANPRLDLDNISTVGKPENINIDSPATNATYRVMAHYYGGSTATHPMIDIYCGGHLKATYGQAPDLVGGFTSGGSWGGGPMWRVVDVTTAGGAAGDCTLNPLHPSGQTTGYNVTSGDKTY